MPISKPRTGVPGELKKIICPNCDGIGRDVSNDPEEGEATNVTLCPECNGVGFLTAKVVKKGEY